ncbi:MAG: metalloregulator ArsR/SmtB family transcription factor [Pseudomonadota bacterium]
MDARVNLPFEDLLTRLKAASEATRLRLLALLTQCELTVSDLTTILGQSQPRISRHLKLLSDAGIIERYPEGAWVYYRLKDTGPGASLIANLLSDLDKSDPQLLRDRERLDEVRTTHARLANDYFDATAREWDDVRGRHVPEDAVEAAMLSMFDGEMFKNHLDVGTGTGRMIELFNDRTERSVGIDANPRMLSIARNKLANHVGQVQVRQADVYNLAFQGAVIGPVYDLVTIHQVLHYLDDPALALREVSRVTAPGGKWIIVDFAPHTLEFMRVDYAHRRLGFSDEQMVSWLDAVGMTALKSEKLEPETVSGEDLTVTVWTAVKP